MTRIFFYQDVKLPCKVFPILLRLPPHPTNPLCPILYILPLHNPFDRIILPSQLLISCHPMYKAMTSTTQPRNTIQRPLIMPLSLQHFRMHTSRNKMMIRQRNPVALANLASLSARGTPDRWCASHTCCVLAEYWGEKFGEVVRVWDESVSGEGIWDCAGDCGAERVEDGAFKGCI